MRRTDSPPPCDGSPREEASARQEGRFDACEARAPGLSGAYQRALFEHAIVAVTDRAGRITQVNDQFCAISKYPREQLIGQTHRVVNSGVHPHAFWQAMWRRISSGQSWQGEICNRARDGSLYWVDTTIVPVTDGEQRIVEYLAIRTVSTGRKQAEIALRRAAMTDALTGLPNRKQLLERLTSILAERGTTPFAVLYMDLDRFKLVNDSLGHAAGDALLRQVSDRLLAALQDDEVRRAAAERFAARLGGDEFVVFLCAGDVQTAARRVASRLLRELAEPYLIDGLHVQMSVSIGVVTSEQCCGGADEVLRDADTAMYEAKRRGRGRTVMFSQQMHEQAVTLLQLHHDMRRGLHENEFHVVYQPIVDLFTGRVQAVEALARWRHPIKGLVPPLEFIAVAEDNGMIAELGEQVLRTACRDLVHWRAVLGEQAPRYVSVNLSRAQLRNGHLVDTVAEVLGEHGLEPAALRLELTESLAVEDPEAIEVLHRLRRLDVTLSLDDFGVGHSSLACLHELPIATVKIDRSLVPQLAGDAVRLALVRATLLVSQALSLEVVAEGIESAEQAALVRELGCHLAQGYLYGRPMPSAALLTMLEAPVPAVEGGA